jgi:hypothetical protein
VRQTTLARATRLSDGIAHEGQVDRIGLPGDFGPLCLEELNAPAGVRHKIDFAQYSAADPRGRRAGRAAEFHGRSFRLAASEFRIQNSELRCNAEF